MPNPAPETKPVPATTVAILVLPVLHTPAVAASYNVVVAPRQTPVVPVILAGSGFTVTTTVEYTLPHHDIAE